jgi:hypothetical protein
MRAAIALFPSVLWLLALAPLAPAAEAAEKEKNASATPAPDPAARRDWLGVWAVFDGPESLVNVIVREGGVVSTTRVDEKTGNPERGTWQATPDALSLRYGPGRGETILRHGAAFRHVDRIPDAERGGFRTRVGSAFRLSSPFATYSGSWRPPAGSRAGAVVLRSDGSATRVGDPRKGLWQPAAGGVAIRWEDGEPELLDLPDPRSSATADPRSRTPVETDAGGDARE